MTDLIDRMLEEDALIREKIKNIPPGESQKFADQFFERHRLYAKYADMARAAGDSQRSMYISLMREGLMVQAMMFKIKGELEGDMAKIISRLDDLETRIQYLEPKK
jgi:hypothetical protein